MEKITVSNILAMLGLSIVSISIGMMAGWEYGLLAFGISFVIMAIVKSVSGCYDDDEYF